MQKFTVFTVILTILVVVVSAETFANKYLPSLTKADITSPSSKDQFTLPKELNLEDKAVTDVENTEISDTKKILSGTDSTDSTVATDLNSGLLGIEEVGADTTGISDTTTSLPTNNGFDIESFSENESVIATSYLSDALILNSGFVGAHLETEVFEGSLYKTIDLTDLKGVKIEKYNVTDDTNTFAKIYVITSDGTIVLEDTYNVIRLRSSQIQDVQINETNEFGLGSFYMNDVRRSSVAFLTVKISDKIYGFTYPKQYHPQVKNLISLLALGNVQL